MRKKILSLLLVISMILSMGVVSFAAETANIKPYAELKLGNLKGKTVILHTNDVHGAIAGYAYMAQLKADYKAAGAEVILVDSGDFSQGTTFASFSQGMDPITMMNAVGYDYATLGNHEFDYGYDKLTENLKKANFKILCADVYDKNGKPIFDATAKVTKGGVKIGFVGLDTPEAQTKINPALIKNITFLSNATTPTVSKAAQDAIDSLKDCDVVIALTHLGVEDESIPYTSYDISKGLTGVDIYLDGHSHTVMTAGKNNENIQSTGISFDSIGVVVIDNASKKIEDHYLVDFDAWEIDNDKMAAVYPSTAKYDAKVAKESDKIIKKVLTEYGNVFAKSEVSLNGSKAPNGNRDSETNNGDLIADSMLWTAVKDGGITVDADHVVAITNGGGIRAAIEPGDVTKNDINTVLPFGNTVYVVYITGTELLEALEASTFSTPEAAGGFPQVAGMDITINTSVQYDAKAETYPDSTYYGPNSIKRVTINDINGKPFSLTDTYAVVTNNFCGAGGDTYYAFAAADTKFDTGITLDEAVMDFVKTELKAVIGETYAQPQDRIGINPFNDVLKAEWFTPYVADLYTNGVINGMSATVFAPRKALTFAEAFKLLLVATGDLKTEDATGDAWSKNTMDLATKLGLCEAGLDGSKAITRLEFCQAAAKLYKMEAATANGEFTDCTDGYVMALYNSGVINGMGDGLFAPAKTLTRAEISKIIYLITQLDKAA